MAETPFPDHSPPVPVIEERFVVKPRFGRTIVRILNADGHLDVAHKMGKLRLKTTLIRQWVEETESINEANEKFISRTRWATVLVTARIVFPDGTYNQCDGLSSASDRDQMVKQPGYEVSVAETRAIKRAIAGACNLTEKYISPREEKPTREFIDMPLRKDEDDEKPGLPEEVLRKPDITPPIAGITHNPAGQSHEEQFDL